MHWVVVYFIFWNFLNFVFWNTFSVKNYTKKFNQTNLFNFLRKIFNEKKYCEKKKIAYFSFQKLKKNKVTTIHQNKIQANFYLITANS
jgi:hypothetical protein